MKVTYKFATGKETIEVTDEWGQIIKDLDKETYNNWCKLYRHSANPKCIIEKHLESEDSRDSFDGDPMDLLEDEHFSVYMEQKEDYEIVCNSIREKLKPKYADIVIAVALNGYKVTEYADMTGISYESAKKRWQRAKNILKNFL